MFFTPQMAFATFSSLMCEPFHSVTERAHDMGASCIQYKWKERERERGKI